MRLQLKAGAGAGDGVLHADDLSQIHRQQAGFNQLIALIIGQPERML